MQHEDVTNISQELEDWEMSINNSVKQCLIDIDSIEKTSIEYDGKVTTEHMRNKNLSKKMFQCDNCSFQSNWGAHLSKHKTDKHKYCNCKFCNFIV